MGGAHGERRRVFREVRVKPVDRDARPHARIWPLISRFEGLIGTESLRLAVRRAEASAPGMTGAT